MSQGTSITLIEWLRQRAVALLDERLTASEFCRTIATVVADPGPPLGIELRSSINEISGASVFREAGSEAVALATFTLRTGHYVGLDDLGASFGPGNISKTEFGAYREYVFGPIATSESAQVVLSARTSEMSQPDRRDMVDWLALRRDAIFDQARPSRG